MKATPLEFSRPLPVDRVPPGGSYEKLEADTEECQALARRIGVPAIHSLTAMLHATPWRGGGLKLEGRLLADLDQVSVVSLDRFRHQVSFALERYFLPLGADAGDGDDADPIVGGEVDMGEAVAETLALELDNYPRQPGEVFAENTEAKEADDGHDSPFAALGKLRNS